MAQTKAPSPLRSAGALQKIIVIGAGHNGLVAAYYLAKAGLKPLVLERREIVGGASVTEEFHPGFRCSTLATSVGPLLPQIINDLQLQKYEVEFIKPSVQVCALNHHAPICIYDDAKRTASELTKLSSKDANSYSDFVATFERIGRALRPLLTMTPPDIDAPTKSELWNLGKLGWKIRGLGKKDEYRLLRYGPMAVADLAAEWFENETLRAVVAACGIFGAFAGPWSGGTTVPLLLQAANGGNPIPPAVFVRGGMGTLAEAIAKAAIEAGAEIQTGADVAGILLKDAKAVGVVLRNGEETFARAVVSNADPKTTFLKLVDAAALDPSFLQKIQNYRAHGTVAKVNLALSALPNFTGVDESEKLAGRIHIW